MNWSTEQLSHLKVGDVLGDTHSPKTPQSLRLRMVGLAGFEPTNYVDFSVQHSVQ